MRPLVLAVEDDATQRLVLQWELERLANDAGFEHQVVGDLAAARAVVEEAGPGRRLFVLCDDRLPDGRGPDFVRQVQAAGHGGVVMTAAGARQDGDVEVQSKPSNLEEQRRWLRQLLGDAGLVP